MKTFHVFNYIFQPICWNHRIIFPSFNHKWKKPPLPLLATVPAQAFQNILLNAVKQKALRCKHTKAFFPGGITFYFNPIPVSSECILHFIELDSPLASWMVTVCHSRPRLEVYSNHRHWQSGRRAWTNKFFCKLATQVASVHTSARGHLRHGVRRGWSQLKGSVKHHTVDLGPFGMPVLFLNQQPLESCDCVDDWLIEHSILDANYRDLWYWIEHSYMMVNVQTI